jgi:3-methylfumaryl-CoA hydratase
MRSPDGSTSDADSHRSVEVRHDQVSEFDAGALHDLLDRPGPRPIAGDELPPLWHWLAFRPEARHEGLGPDGHPKPGGILPPMHGKARVWAGAHVVIDARLHVGETLIRRARVGNVETKSGRTGELTLVSLDNQIQPDEPGAKVLHDQQSLIYRDMTTAKPKQSQPGRTSNDLATTTAWARTVEIEPTFLFRFSALTYNAHRIHYDRTYATQVEGYPGLVVHGPLQAVLLADSIERAHPGMRLAAITVRAKAPAFDNQPLELQVSSIDSRSGASSVVTAAVTRGDTTTMTASAVLEPLT